MHNSKLGSNVSCYHDPICVLNSNVFYLPPFRVMQICHANKICTVNIQSLKCFHVSQGLHCMKVGTEWNQMLSRSSNDVRCDKWKGYITLCIVYAPIAKTIAAYSKWLNVDDDKNLIQKTIALPWDCWVFTKQYVQMIVHGCNNLLILRH